jgi:hypothetical protein
MSSGQCLHRFPPLCLDPIKLTEAEPAGRGTYKNEGLGSCGLRLQMDAKDSAALTVEYMKVAQELLRPTLTHALSRFQPS